MSPAPASPSTPDGRLQTSAVVLAETDQGRGVLNAVHIPLSEEPGLVKRFGEEYLTYKANVPRWIPRIRAWQAKAGTNR
jgi:hypothetical protein